MRDKVVNEMVRIKKVYDKHYTVINNSILNDTSLKWEDKGLFTYLWSQSDEWDFYAKEVAKHCVSWKNMVIYSDKGNEMTKVN